MRDKDRIFPICAIIGEKWRDTCPDWRFMQLMNNFMSWLGTTSFYMEDEEFIKKFEQYINEINK